MTVIPRQVDQWIVIGRRSLVGPTDIDARSARLLVKSEVFGGADDGAWVERAVELTVGQSVSLGSNVVVTLMAVIAGTARIGVMAPPNVPVLSKEAAESAKRKRDAL
ncbi:MAG: carbon storage regulator [Tepidisphaeraceae bacterium]